MSAAVECMVKMPHAIQRWMCDDGRATATNQPTNRLHIAPVPWLASKTAFEDACAATRLEGMQHGTARAASTHSVTEGRMRVPLQGARCQGAGGAPGCWQEGQPAWRGRGEGRGHAGCRHAACHPACTRSISQWSLVPCVL